MPIRECLGKTVGFLVVSASLIGGGLLVAYGPHAYNDYLNTALAGLLILLGVITAGLGVLIIGVGFFESRHRRRIQELHVTPRSGPPSKPPAWGMGDVGRPGEPVEVDRGAPVGGGQVRVMSVIVSDLDGPLLIAVLLIWTVVGLALLAPH